MITEKDTDPVRFAAIIRIPPGLFILRVPGTVIIIMLPAVD